MAVERVIRLTIGTEATGKFVEAITGDDDDILLAIERLIQERLDGGPTTDPNTDPMGVYVNDFGLPR